MAILNPPEKNFLDVFLYEATHEPFTGPGTKALHSIGVEYRDISYINWAYGHEVPLAADYLWGHPADVAPPLPWPDRDAALRRNEEVKRLWEQQQRQPVAAHRS